MCRPSRHPLQDIYLRELFENLELGVLIADDDARYVDANRRACELYDRRLDQLIGRHLSEFIEGARAADVNAQWRAFLRDGIQSGVFAIQLPNGGSRRFHFQAQANFVPGLHCSFISALADETDAGPRERHLTICAWTKRVLVDGRWMALEDYLLRVHGVSVSHGICPEASAAFGEKERQF